MEDVVQTIPPTKENLEELRKENALRRFQKAKKKEGLKPRKDWHIKAFKNPAEIITAVSLGAQRKSEIAANKLVLLGIMGGIYIGFGGVVALTMAGGLDTTFANAYPTVPRFLNAITFPAALFFIVVVGGELFTSNVMYMTVGLLSGSTKVTRALIVLICSFITNYLGTVLAAAFTVHFADFITTAPYTTYLSKMVTGKVLTPSWGVLVLRAIPANMCVNLAILLATAAEDLSGKFLAIWTPIFLFAGVGMEHLIANEFYVHVAMFNGLGTPYGKWLWNNFLAVALGNIIGGAFMGLIYWYCYLAELTLPPNAQWLIRGCGPCATPMKPQQADDEESSVGPPPDSPSSSTRYNHNHR